MVGAGISGLAAAESLASRGRDVVAIDADPRAGGALATTREGGWLLEHAAHGVLAAPDASDILGLLDWLKVPVALARPEAKRREVVHRGRLVALPTSPLALLRTPLLPLGARVRVLRERSVAPGRREESVLAFATRRFGAETAALADAFVTGVYAGDPASVSLDHAFPRVRALEREHGSVLRGLARSKTRPRLLAPAEGMQALVDALAERVRPRTRETVVRVAPSPSGYVVETERESIEARGVVLATGPTGGRILQRNWYMPRSAPVAVVGLGYRSEDVDAAGYGFLAPDRERRFVLGVLYESTVFDGRAPAGRVLLRALVGGIRHPERAGLPDGDLVRAVADDLRDLGVARADPVWSRVVRTGGVAQIEIGHGRLLAEVAAAEEAHSGLAVTGAGVRAVAVKDLVADARAAADRVAAALG